MNWKVRSHLNWLKREFPEIVNLLTCDLRLLGIDKKSLLCESDKLKKLLKEYSK